MDASSSCKRSASCERTSNRYSACSTSVTLERAAHVPHILDELQVENRVQAVLVAYESRLVTPGEPMP